MPAEYFKVKCIKVLLNWDVKAAYGMQEQVGDEESNPAPSEGLDQAQRSWFSDLHAASSQHGFAGVSSATSLAQEDPQGRRIGCKRMHHAERQKLLKLPWSQKGKTQWQSFLYTL